MASPTPTHTPHTNRDVSTTPPRHTVIIVRILLILIALAVLAVLVAFAARACHSACRVVSLGCLAGHAIPRNQTFITA